MVSLRDSYTCICTQAKRTIGVTMEEHSEHLIIKLVNGTVSTFINQLYNISCIYRYLSMQWVFQEHPWLV